MKKKVPGHGRSRDEEPAGRAGPRRICQSPSQFRFQFPSQFLYPPSEVRIWRFGQILTSLERFRVLIAKFGILSTQRIPGLRGRFASEILLEKGIYLKTFSRYAGNLVIVIL